MKQIIGIVFLLFTSVAVISNASLMLISPKTWLRLPVWMKLTANFTERTHGTQSGQLKIRLLGAFFLSVMLWMLHGCLARP